MLRQYLARALVLGAFGLAWGTGACGGSAPAASTSGVSANEKQDTASEADKDEELAAQIAKESSEEADSKKAGDSGNGAQAEQGEGGPPKTDEARKMEIWKLIKERRKPVLDCYKDARQKNPKIGVKLVVSFTLNPDGSFKEQPTVSKERSDITDQQVITCAVETVKGIKFPPHPKGMETTFYYPYGF
jgi:hypothetical protein